LVNRTSIISLGNLLGIARAYLKALRKLVRPATPRATRIIATTEYVSPV